MGKFKNPPLIAFALTTSVGVLFVDHNNQVYAGTDTETAAFSVQVNSNCAVKNPIPVAFGSYDPVATNAIAPLDATGSFDVKCNKGGSGILSIDGGLNPSGTDRRMKSGTSNYLTYNLYTSAARTTVWNETNTVQYGPPATGQDFTEIVYGRIPGAQINAVAGSYSDTVVVTVTY